MKKIIFSSLAAVALLSVQSCKTDFENDVNDAEVTSGTADFTKFVALGNSLTSGFRDGALYVDGQNESFTSMIAKQMQKAGGAQMFNQPMMADNLGGIPGVLPNKYVLTVNAAGAFAPALATGNGTSTLANIYTAQGFQNMGVPLAKSYHLLAPGYGNPANLSAGMANPFFVRMASSANATVLGDAMVQNPTFFSLWIGSNDVLGYATSGGDGTNPITPLTTFTDAYTALTTTLTSNGAKGIVANIPNVTSIPFFTTVPYNPVPPSAFNTAAAGQPSNQDANIDALNAQVFTPLINILNAVGHGGRLKNISKTSANPLLIKDESLPNLASQITQALVLGGASPQQAGLMGIVFGQARHATSNDLTLLSTSSVIGTAPTSVYAVAPFNKYGVTFPLEDKHVLRGEYTASPSSGSEANEVKNTLEATVAFNDVIKAKATEKNLAFFDANTKMAELSSASGISFDNVRYTAKFVTGGTFSLDGVHLTGRGYAITANEFIKAINKKYGSTLPQVNVNSYTGVTFP